MASGAIILVLMVLVVVILLSALESHYQVIFDRVVNMTYVLVGSLLGIILAAILANFLLWYYKRRESLTFQERGVGGQVFVYATQKSVPDTSYTNSTNFTQHNNLLPRSSSSPSCQCSTAPHVPSPKRVSPTVSHTETSCSTQIDDQLDREIIVHTPRPDVFIETRPAVVAVEVHDDSEKVQVTSGNSGQLESYC